MPYKVGQWWVYRHHNGVILLVEIAKVSRSYRRRVAVRPIGETYEGVYIDEHCLIRQIKSPLEALAAAGL